MLILLVCKVCSSILSLFLRVVKIQLCVGGLVSITLYAWLNAIRGRHILDTIISCSINVL